MCVWFGGSVPKTTKNALSAFLLDALVNSGNYRTIERSESFLAEAEPTLGQVGDIQYAASKINA